MAVPVSLMHIRFTSLDVTIACSLLYHGARLEQLSNPKREAPNRKHYLSSNDRVPFFNFTISAMGPTLSPALQVQLFQCPPLFLGRLLADSIIFLAGPAVRSYSVLLLPTPSILNRRYWNASSACPASFSHPLLTLTPKLPCAISSVRRYSRFPLRPLITITLSPHVTGEAPAFSSIPAVATS